MRNIVGSPVERGDFFDRPRDLARLQRDLNNDANLLITAPRRVGKTSLVLRLCELERGSGGHAVLINVEGCHDELAFAEKLIDGLCAAGLHPDAMGRLRLSLARMRKGLGGVKVGAAGVDMEMDAGEGSDQSTLGRALENIFHRIETDGKRVLLAIDEMPELLLALGRLEHGADRVGRLLHWLRFLRQTYRTRVRWVFLGSIGLDTFVDDRNLRKTVNDLIPFNLEALSLEEAHEFLKQLGDSNRLPISEEARSAIIERIGWPLPHHLQVIFHALIDLEIRAVDPLAIEEALRRLLCPEHLSQFDTWRQRLEEQFSDVDSRVAKTILRLLCQHPNGCSRPTIMDTLMRSQASANPEEMGERLARLLQILQRDGYLLESHGNYTFRSFLIREYWQRREIR